MSARLRPAVAPDGYYLGLLLFFSVLAYGVSLGYGFVWDDQPLILENELLRDPHGVFKIFFRNFWDVGGRNDAFRHFYRPLVTFSYWLNAKLGGLRPGGFHAVNLGLHLACVALAFRLLRPLLPSGPAAFVAGIYFALHPCHVENVGWISGRTDLLAACFSLAALSCWLRADRGRSAWLAAACACYGLALLSKESAVLLPLAWLVWPLREDGPWLQSSPRRRRGLLWAGLTLLAYLALRRWVLGVLGSNQDFPGLALYLPALGWVLFSYLRLALSGWATDPHYSDVQFKFMHGATAVEGLLLLAVLAAIAWRLLRRGGTPARGLWLAGLFLAPVLWLGSFGDVLYADRFLYLPSLGLALWVGRAASLAADHLPGGRRRHELALLAGGGLLSLVLLTQTVPALAVWSDDVRLFEAASRTSKDSVMIWNNLCLAYSHAGRYREAEAAGREALALDPRHAYSLHNVGVAIRRQGRPQDALPYLRAAVDREPLDSLFTYNLAEALAASGDRKAARAWYRRTLTLKPDNQEARHNLGYLLLQAGRFAEARPLLETAARLSKHSALAWNSLGILAALEGRRDEASRCFQQALAEDPNLDQARDNLLRLQGRKP